MNKFKFNSSTLSNLGFNTYGKDVGFLSGSQKLLVFSSSKALSFLFLLLLNVLFIPTEIKAQSVSVCADGTPKKTPGTACNDWNPNTTNDVIQADGCSCAGTTPPPICDNVLNGGTISKSCNNGIVSLTASTPVTGGTGAIEYIWLKSTQGCPGDPAQAIAGATGESYTIPAGSVTQTTYFARCARRVGCTVWSGSSNCISVSPNECTTTPNTCNFAPCFKSTISVLASPNWTGYASWNLSNMPSSGWTTGPFQYSSDGGSTWTTLSFSFSPSSTGIGMITYNNHYQYRVTIYNSAGTCSQTLTWTFTNPPCGICGDGSARRVPGTACNDNNPNTTNDIVQPDGCSCAGTPVNGNICDFSPCLAVSDIYTQWATPDKKATWTLAQMPSSGWTNTVFQYSKDGGATWLNLSQKFSPTKLSIASLPYGNIYQEDPYLYRATFQNTAGTCTQTINWSAATPVHCTPCADGSPKKVPGTACNDNNPNTVNDVIQADGCSCAGTPTSTVTCNYTPCFKASNIANGFATWTLSQMPSSGWTTTAFQYSSNGGSTWTNFSTKFSPTTLSIGMVPYGANYKFRVIFQNSAGTCTQTITWDAISPYCGSLCDNVTSGGTVSKVCNSTNGTISLNETTPASGGNGQLEYIWLRSTTGCPGDPVQAIPGETSRNLTVNASTITQTTYFARCVRRVGCSVWTGSSNCITVSPNECSPCNNVTFGGTVSKVCNSTNGTISINETTPASGGSGQLEYIWLRSTTGCPGDPAQAIPGETSTNLTISLSSITQTTYFARCVRRVGCSVWTGSSNCITVSPNECATGSIGDFTFCDNNSNGIFDNGDTPQSGVQVQLCNASNVIIATATTDAQGKYLFPNLAAGIYVVKFPATITGGKTITTTNPITVNLTSGQNYLDADAGYKPACNLAINITNKTCNNNGTPSNPNDDTYSFTLTVTGGTGSWSGSYNNSYLGVFQIPTTPYGTAIQLGPFPAGSVTSTNTNPPITVPSIDISINVNDVQNTTCTKSTVVTSTGTCSTAPLLGSIGDLAYCDNNNNSVFDNGDTPQSGVQIQLCNSSNVIIATATTDAQGKYLFPNLAAGIYVVKFPASITGGKTITTQSPITVNLSAGQNYLDADAGYYKPAVPTCPDGTPKKTPGSTCNDNNPNTTNDVIQADGCGCAGTPVNNNDFCTNPTANVTTGAGSITISGITSSSAIVQIFNGSWVSVFNQTTTTATVTVPNLPNGTYYVKVTVLGSGGSWPAKCEKMVTVTVSGGSNNLCADGTPKKTPGSACNDNNPNTTNDVIQADGCGCAGTPITPNCNENRNNTITKSCVSGKPVLSGTALAGYEYMWISSTTTCAVNGSQPIPGATGQNYYLPSNVTQTTYFSRCARPIGCTEWGAIAESNCITVTPADCGTSAGGCDAISVVGNTNGTIGISGLGAFTSMVQIFNSQWQPVFSQQYNAPTASIPVKNGGYIVKIQLYNTNGTWQFVCEKMVTGINVSGGTFSLASGRVVLDLAATPELHTVKLAWANNTGYKNDYFEVEKLNEKSNAFEKIATINSMSGDKLEYYTAFDEQPTEGDNIYRINLVGTDGTTKVSNQSVVKFNKAYDFRIFPNPASDFIEVDLKQYEGKNATIQVYNSFGTIVSTQHIEKVSAQPVHVDLGQAPAGQYLIRVSSDGKKQAAKKFVIQN